MSQVKKVIASTMLGNGLEWYDYALYGTFTALNQQAFFSGRGRCRCVDCDLWYFRRRFS